MKPMGEVLDSLGELREIARLSRRPTDKPLGRDRLIRYLDAHGQTEPESPIVDSLCAHFGLFPYISDTLQEGSAEALAVEFHSPQELAGEGFTFHAEQQEVYSRLMDGESLILSAPTSFGKSAILDALVASNRWARIVLIVPTIALIDETRRRLARFREHYSIVTSPKQVFGERAVFILTQERFLEIDHLDDVDFFVIDEFYKLGTDDVNDQRRSLLNLAWKRLRATGAQYYLIGPNVDAIDQSVSEDLRSKLVKSEFRTVSVDVIDRSGVEDDSREADLRDLVSVEADGSTLVFASSPDRAERLSIALIGAVQTAEDGLLAEQVADWLGENYDPAWRAVRALKAGIATHTGVMPRSVQRLMVKLFNDGHVPVMVCTSTLIEGVNTAAKNVVIFDHRIDGQLLDFFTFSNIRGRAGRMFRHFVGRVYTYRPPPENVSTDVDIPIESQSDRASLATLAQLGWDELEVDARERVRHVFDQDDLSLGTIRTNRGLDPDLQIALARRLLGSPTEAEDLGWSSLPAASRIKRTLQTAWDELIRSRQKRGVNFEMVWGQLQNSRINGQRFSSLVDQQERYLRSGRDRGDAVLDVFRFQRHWMEFNIPSMLRGLQSVQGEIAERLGVPRANYEFLLREIESLYLLPGITELEEYGIPIPLGIKLFQLGVRGETTADVLAALEARHRSDLVPLLSPVERWILADVVRGISG